MRALGVIILASAFFAASPAATSAAVTPVYTPIAPNNQRAMYCLGYLSAAMALIFPKGCPTSKQIQSLNVSQGLADRTVRDCKDRETTLHRLKTYFLFHPPTVAFMNLSLESVQRGRMDASVCRKWFDGTGRRCMEGKDSASCLNNTRPHVCNAFTTCVDDDGLPW